MDRVQVSRPSPRTDNLVNSNAQTADGRGHDPAPDWSSDVAEVMRRAAAQDAITMSVEPSRLPLVGMVSLVTALVLVAGWNVMVLTRPVPPLAREEQQAALESVLIVLVEGIEAYRVRHGEYPLDLTAIAPPLQGIAYEPVASRGYLLHAKAHDVQVTYVSEDGTFRPVPETTGPPGQGGDS